MNINKAMKNIKAANFAGSMDEIEKRSPIKIGDTVTIKKRLPSLRESCNDLHKYKLVPGIVVDIIEVYGDSEAVEMRVAPKLRNERIGNPIIKWWNKDNEISEVLILI